MVHRWSTTSNCGCIRGNPVENRDCPAAVSGNDRRESALEPPALWSGILGSERPVGSPFWVLSASPKTCQRWSSQRFFVGLEASGLRASFAGPSWERFTGMPTSCCCAPPCAVDLRCFAGSPCAALFFAARLGGQSPCERWSSELPAGLSFRAALARRGVGNHGQCSPGLVGSEA